MLKKTRVIYFFKLITCERITRCVFHASLYCKARALRHCDIFLLTHFSFVLFRRHVRFFFLIISGAGKRFFV